MSGDPSLHPAFPTIVRMVVEQPREARYRLRFDDRHGRFYVTDVPSLLYDKGFPGVYGWVEGLGHPPGSHCDIFLLSRTAFQPGDVVDAHVCGVLVRGDRDHKVFAVDADWANELPAWDLDALPEQLRHDVMALYPVLLKGERWAGAREAWALLESIRTKRFVPNAD